MTPALVPPPAPAAGTRQRLGAWAELLRVSALFTVPGDAVAGAAASGVGRPRTTALAIGCSLCLYEAGMALNDWADRAEDAAERPHRPLPSGRITARAALLAAGALTAAGLALAARASRPALLVASALAGTVWAYDLRLKHTPWGPLAMGAARGLDVLLGAAAQPGARTRSALAAASTLTAHTTAVTAVSRHEVRGGSVRAPLAALAASTALGGALVRGARGRTRGLPLQAGRPRTGARGPVPPAPPAGRVAAAAPGPPGTILTAALAAGYALSAGRPLLHAALNPSPQLTGRAVGGGIRAMIPLQGALAARTGSLGGALATAALAPLAKALSRRVSPT
ncbi:SCO3242 family prenyltransferase [Streptomyces sp. CA-253872]|uniref:SCO3242 family prenyltransferase n=1 Tax=Streptomyces sp. CA-253872 TaxID=3240067 RepID=UPI003D916EA1